MTASGNYIMPMARMKPGQAARVARLDARGDIRRRMQDIGIIPGTLIECVRRSPLGDPSAYLIRGAVIALRESDALGVTVTAAARAECPVPDNNVVIAARGGGRS